MNLARGITGKNKLFAGNNGQLLNSLNIEKKLAAVLLSLAVGLVPLIVRLKIVRVHPSISDFWPLGESDADFFSYYKSVVLFIISALSLILLLVAVLRQKECILSSKAYIPMAAYVFLTIISAVLSQYKHTALFGFPGRYEGLFAALSYAALFFTAAALLGDEKGVKIIMTCLVTSSLIISALGILQFLKLDFFMTPFGKQLITGDAAGSNPTLAISAAQADTPYENASYGTLFNSNTFGAYIAMLFPMSLVLALAARKKPRAVLAAIFSLVLFICLLGSYSRGAYAGAAAGVLSGAAILIYKRVFKWKRLLAIAAAFIIAFAAMNLYSGGTIGNRLFSMIRMKNDEPARRNLDKVRDIKISGDALVLYSEFTELRIKLRQDGYSFMDENNNALVLKPTGESMYSFENEKYKSYMVQVSGNLINIVKDKSFLLFGVVNNKFVPVGFNGKAIEIRPVESFGFSGKERFASARGYIWSRTLPMLKHTILIGYGPDNFAMYFPQDDYLGKLNFMYDANILIDKPHNIYLQIAVNTGIVSLLCFLSLVAFFSTAAVRRLEKLGTEDNYFIYIALICAAVPGFLVSCLLTDSTVSVSPVFWVLLGLGFGILEKLDK
jgi:hypothetical protein